MVVHPNNQKSSQLPADAHGIAIHRDAVALFANPAFAQLLGVSVDTILGRSLIQYIAPHDRARVRGYVEAAETHTYHIQIIGAGNRLKDVVVAAKPTTFQGEDARLIHVLPDANAQGNRSLSDQRFHTLMEHAPDGIVLLDAELEKFVGVNERALQLFGYDRATFLSLPFGVFSPEKQSNGSSSEVEAKALVQRSLDGEIVEFNWEHVHADGSLIPCEVRLVRLPDPERLILRGSIIDNREQNKMAQLMKKLTKAVDQTADLIMITDTNGVIEYVNPAFERVTGYSKEACQGKTPSILRSDKYDPNYFDQMWQTILNGEVFVDTVVNRCQDGSHYWEKKTITPLRDDFGKITHFVSTGKDITQQIQNRQKIRFMANHDPLTQLPNRENLSQRLEQVLVHAGRHARIVAVLIINLDRFTLVTDSIGFQGGDRVLVRLARLLESLIRTGDMVARLGGDEFAILLDDMAKMEDLAAFAEKLMQLLRQPLEINDRCFYLTASIGIATYPQDGQRGVNLLKHAGLAMRQAKGGGGDRFWFYTRSLNTVIQDRLDLEHALRMALENNGFRIHYQPQLCLSTEKIMGLEALMRWERPGVGLVPPNRFIPILEETGLIVPVTEWLLRQVFADLRTGRIPKNTRVSVNLSGRQFADSDSIQQLERVLTQCPFAPNQLEIELTETIMLQNPEATIATLKQWRGRGIRIAIDDFGTGYSSLSYLCRYPVDTLKIDRSFVKDMLTSAEAEAIVKSIVGMAQNLNLEIIAEGVESEPQYRFFQDLGCHMIQGYWISKPLPLDDFPSCFAHSQGYA